jgi:nitrite reductase/ring-hydroxylating ferredoxin subunit
LPENELTKVEHEGRSVIVVRNGSEVFGYEDRCPHAFWPLSEGTLAGSVLECPGHAWEFDVTTGRCLTSPAYCLKPVAVRIQDDSSVPSGENGEGSGGVAEQRGWAITATGSAG